MSDDRRLAMVDALMAWMDTRRRRSEFEQRRGDRLLGANDRSGDDALEERRLAQAEQYAESMYRLALTDYVAERGHPHPEFTAPPHVTIEPWPNIPSATVQALLP